MRADLKNVHLIGLEGPKKCRVEFGSIWKPDIFNMNKQDYAI